MRAGYMRLGVPGIDGGGVVGFFGGVPLRLGTGLWDAYECRVVR